MQSASFLFWFFFFCSRKRKKNSNLKKNIMRIQVEIDETLVANKVGRCLEGSLHIINEKEGEFHAYTRKAKRVGYKVKKLRTQHGYANIDPDGATLHLRCLHRENIAIDVAFEDETWQAAQFIREEHRA